MGLAPERSEVPGPRAGAHVSRERRRPYAVNACDPDRPEPRFGFAELLRQASVPAVWEENVLMDADGPFMFRSFEPGVQSIRCARAVRNRDNFMDGAWTKAGRSEKVAAQNLAVRKASYQ
jgi:hypothetical protein